MASKYQTLSGFLIAPFNNEESLQRDAEYDSKYRKFILSNSIKIHAMCELEDSYYIHIKIPSESQKNNNYEYDVVIRFFTDKPDILKQDTLINYYIQFFSNSPSFMYQFAYLYNKEGYLIKALYNKIDADYINTPPEKTNKEMKTSYDKSIYFACRYLSEQKFRYLNKRGRLLSKKIDPKKFFANISDFKSVKLDQALMSEERKLSALIKEKAPKDVIGKIQSVIAGTKIEAGKPNRKALANKYKKVVSKRTKISAKAKKYGTHSTRKR